MEPISTEHGKIAFEFATALMNANFVKAHSMLTLQQKKEWDAPSLKKEYEEMIDYGSGPIRSIQVMNEMTDWPAKNKTDIGWAYAAMSGEGYSEAVSVVVSNINGKLLIREIEWGRP